MIKVKNLSLKTKNKTILENINFETNEREIIGLLGHNAAGKSTLQRFIANEEVVQTGRVFINNKENQFGIFNECVLITEKLFLKQNLSVMGNIKHLNAFEQLDVEYILNKLSEFKIDVNVSFGSLSRGNKQIIHILICLSKKALVYLLDEPLSSIDIFNRKKIADLLLDAQDRGATIVITTHLLNDFQMLFDRVIYINEGKIDFDITIEEIFERGYKDVEDFVVSEYGGGVHV